MADSSQNLTSSSKKSRRITAKRMQQRTRVMLLHQHERCIELKRKLGIQTDSQMAKMLIDRKKSIGAESILLEEPEVHRSRWRSIRVMYLTMFLSSVSFSICMSSLYPYLKVLDKSATTGFLGWVVAAYSLGQLFAAPLFGAWANIRANSREPIVVSLTINILANFLYMSLESIETSPLVFFIIARVFIGFGAGNAAVVRSYTAGATTMKERTPAMANMSACQAFGFIIGPVIQAALVPVGYPGPVHGKVIHLDMYTAPALLSVLLGVLNVVLIIVVFKEHTITDRQYITNIQDTAEESAEPNEDDSAPLDYVAVVSSIVLFFIVLFIFSIFETIATPVSMHMFAWTKAEATLYVGVILGGAGVVSILDFVVIKVLAKRFNERKLMLGGFLLCLLGFIAYMPWGHHYPDIQYAATSGSTFINTTNTSSFVVSDLADLDSNYVGNSRRRLLSILDNMVDEKPRTNHSTEHTMSKSITSTHSSLTTPTSSPVHNVTYQSSLKTSSTYIISTETTVQAETTHSEPFTTRSSTEPITHRAHTTRSTTHKPHTTESTHKTQTSESTTRKPHTTEVTTHKTRTTQTTQTKTTDQTTKGHQTTELSSPSHRTKRPSTEPPSTKITTHSGTIETTTSHTHDNTTAEAVGCPYTYKWCFDTPAILLWQFIIGTLLVSLGYPTCSVMSYTMYSKILGPKPQGVWMGWMTAAGSLSRTLGPVFVSQVYDAYGPRVTMGAICGVIVLTIGGLMAIYKRLVPYKLKRVVRVNGTSNGHVTQPS